MPAVDLAPLRPLDQVPRQLLLDRPSLVGLAAACEVSLPPLVKEVALRPLVPEEVAQRPSRRARNQGPDPAPELRAALTRFATATDGVDLDLAVRRRDGTRRVRSWQRRHDGWVTTLATADGRHFELGWCADRGWPAVLTRAARVRPAGPTTLPAVVDLPLDLLLGVGEARSSGRIHVIDELLRRHAGQVREGVSVERLGPSADPRRLVSDLQADVQGRLRAVVVSYAGRAAGVIEWLLFPDAWRSLATYPRDGLTTVRLEVRVAEQLPVDVAATLTSVVARARRPTS